MREGTVLALRCRETGEIRTDVTATIHSELLPADEQRQHAGFLVPRLEIEGCERWESGFLVGGKFITTTGG